MKDTIDRGVEYVCAHCGLRARDWKHLEGEQKRLHTCAVDPYGFTAHPVDIKCPVSCIGKNGWAPK